MTPPAPACRIRSLEQGDRPGWDRLYQGYAEFYAVPQTPQMRDTVFGWLMDPSHECEGLVAEAEEGELLGLTHFRPFASPLRAVTNCFLDDLFVTPEARGSGAAAALIEEVQRRASERGWKVLRWITADDNYRARGVYDRLATRTGWITYDMAP